MFHILRPADKGGESLFLDGFNAARILYEKDPHAYHVLSTTRTNAIACGNNYFNIQPAHAYPLLNHTPVPASLTESITGAQPSVDRLFQIRYNNDDRAPLCLDVNETREYYRALCVWQSIVRDPSNILEIALSPGLVVCFDNWRVLHGRNAFVGRRQVCGCYHSADDWHSRLRALSEKQYNNIN
jgi:alpha-ketoglutarate-dependent taurine dioxygenase